MKLPFSFSCSFLIGSFSVAIVDEPIKKRLAYFIPLV